MVVVHWHSLSSKVDLRLTHDAMAILTNNDQDKSHIFITMIGLIPFSENKTHILSIPQSALSILRCVSNWANGGIRSSMPGPSIDEIPHSVKSVHSSMEF